MLQSMESQRVRLDLGLNNKTIKCSDLDEKGKQEEKGTTEDEMAGWHH